MKTCIACNRQGVRGFKHMPAVTVTLSNGQPYLIEAMDRCVARKACINRVKLAIARQPPISAAEFRAMVEAMPARDDAAEG